MSPPESWKIVPSQPNLEASSQGNVRSRPQTKKYRQGNRWGGSHEVTREFPPTFLEHSDNGHGYRRINRKNQTLYVHRLVAEAFLPNPRGLPQVNHIDGNRSNNTVENLEWVSATENALHARDILESSGTSPSKALEALQMRLAGARMMEVAAFLGVLPSSVWNMFNSRFPNEPWKGRYSERRQNKTKRVV